MRGGNPLGHVVEEWLDFSLDLRATQPGFGLVELAHTEQRAARLCRTADEAEDLAQEAALRLWQRLEGPAEIEHPEHYAMITLHNLARQRWRSRRPTEELSDDMAQTPPAAPAGLACAEPRAAIERLPCQQA